METKLIVFDIGGTVFSKGKQAFIDLLAQELNKNRKEIADIIDGPHALDYRRSKISAREYWRIVAEQLNRSDLGDLEKLWFDQYIPITNMPELVAQLRKHYKTAYLSNNTPERVAYLQKKYSFLDWFDGGIFSYEVRTVKSDGGLYEELLKRFNVFKPQEILVIDDREQNLPTIQKLGFQAILFQNSEQLISELEKRGILPVAKVSPR